MWCVRSGGMVGALREAEVLCKYETKIVAACPVDDKPVAP